MNREGYLVPREGIWIWQNPHGGMLYTTTKLTYRLNNDALEIIKLCNGKATFDDILQSLCKEGKKLTLDDIEKIRKFIYNLVNMDILQISSVPLAKEFLIVGEREIFQPIHCTVELTNACNLKCNYCYNNTIDLKQNKYHGYLANPIAFFSRLYKQGIRVVELSGGEPLLHPEIYDILKFAGKTFTHIALLTNGLLLDASILAIAENLGKRFTLQISIPSIKPARYYRITGMDVWDKVFKNISQLPRHDITFRIAMVVIERKV
ncbi:MAG: radical SAM protein [bacterium]